MGDIGKKFDFAKGKGVVAHKKTRKKKKNGDEGNPSTLVEVPVNVGSLKYVINGEGRSFMEVNKGEEFVFSADCASQDGCSSWPIATTKEL